MFKRLFPSFFCSIFFLQSYGQCDKIIKSEYDKFEKKDVRSLVAIYSISTDENQIDLIPHIGYPGLLLTINNINPNGSYQITNRIARQGNSQIQTTTHSNVILLLEDESVIKLENRLTYFEGAKCSEIEIAFQTNNVNYGPEARKYWKDVRSKLRNLNVVSIRLGNLGMYSDKNIDIDLADEQQYFIKNYFQCIWNDTQD